MPPNGRGDKFILHWLNESRSHRVLWLLELLDLDYEVKIYLRHPLTWRAPPELSKVHPTGKAPILEIIHSHGSEKLKLAESGLIVQYLLKHYDTEGLLTPEDPIKQLQVDYYLHYSEGSLQHILISLLINSVAKSVAPFGLKSVTKLVTKGLNNGYYIHEWRRNMEFLENQLIKEGTGYFVGDRLSGADIFLSFPIYENIFDNEEGVKEVTGEKRSLYKLYPNLAAWSDKIRKNPSYIKISEMMEDKIQEYFRNK